MPCKHYSTAQTRCYMVHIHKEPQHLTEMLGGQKTWEGTVLWDFKSIRRLSRRVKHVREGGGIVDEIYVCSESAIPVCHFVTTTIDATYLCRHRDILKCCRCRSRLCRQSLEMYASCPDT